MGWVCSTNEKEEERIQDLGGKTRRKQVTRKTLDVGRRTILKWIEINKLRVWNGFIWLRRDTSGGTFVNHKM
jgi:hypothetical protein